MLRRSKSSEEHPDVLRARAQTMTECLATAATYEQKGADAGTVRMVLGYAALEAWKTYFERVEPGRSLDATAHLQGDPLRRAVASSEPDGLMASSTNSASAEGDGSGSLDSSNVIEMQFAHDAGERCHRCGQLVTWVDHLPPVSLYGPVRCFVKIVEERQRLGFSVKVPE